jgi:cellulose biosynthesis protein BcsQ
MQTQKILITSQKGGVGKSSIAANLAAAYAVQHQRRTVLLDLDHQGTSSKWIQDGQLAHRPGLLRAMPIEVPNNKGAGVATLHAKDGLRRAGRDADAIIADLTWNDVLHKEFFFDFDLVLVPTSLSPIELASSLDFISRFRSIFNAADRPAPELVIVPSRVQSENEYLAVMNRMDFPVAFHMAPPIPYSNLAQDSYRRDYFLNSQDAVLRHAFARFSSAIERFASLRQRKAESRALTISQRVSTEAGLLREFVAARSARSPIVEVNTAPLVANGAVGLRSAIGRTIPASLLKARPMGSSGPCSTALSEAAKAKVNATSQPSKLFAFLRRG